MPRPASLVAPNLIIKLQGSFPRPLPFWPPDHPRRTHSRKRLHESARPPDDRANSEADRPGIRPAGRGRQGRPLWHPESMGLARLTAMPSIRQAAYGKADRCGLSVARLTVMARFSTFSGRKNAKGGVKPQVAKIEAASRGHKSCHNGHPCHPSAITVALAIRKLRPSPLPSGRNSHPPCRCDDANARTKKQQELSERGYFAIPAPSISDGELLQGEAPPCHSANALHRSFETQQGNRATKKGWRRIRSDASLWCGRARRMPPRTNQ